MPVARIVTSVPELSGGLVRDLNSRGFEVHIVSPEQEFSGKADLEIRIDVAGTEAITAILNTTVAETDSAEMQSPEALPEDIWALLRDFSGDAPETSGVPAQEAVAAQAAMTGQEPLAASALADENNSEPAPAIETKPDEHFAEIIPGPMDPELVPSMFGLANMSDAAYGVPAASGLHREISPSAKKAWEPRSNRLAAAAAACAMIAIVLLLTFAHRRAPLPSAVNSSSHDATTSMQLPFHPATGAASPSVVPVKALIASDNTSSVKTSQHSTAHDSGIAEDTIEHFGSVAKTTPRQKQSGIRYYSDME